MKDVIIALDFKDGKSAMDFLQVFGEKRPFVKVGMELFYSEGPAIVKALKDRGHNVFLDLKLHDIPNTVRGGMRSLAGLGADIVNVHASGGAEMMRAAMEGAVRPDGTRPLVIAVTQLTSTRQDMLENELLIKARMVDVIQSYAENAKAAGLDGIVCSPLEVPAVKAALGKDFIVVTPGIRFEDAKADDQVRITSPAEARILGSDFIVVGRPITKAEDPLAAYERCVKDFMEA